MAKIDYRLWKQAFPFICIKCDSVMNMKRQYCEFCGKENCLRPTTKSDYNRKYKKVKEL